MRWPVNGYKKGKLKRETEYVIITAQNNVIKTNYIKVRILNDIYLTPPLGQDMTQGQFF